MRLFVALEVPESLQRTLATLQERLKPALAEAGLRARWVPPGHLHLTLAFLGEVAEARLPALGSVLAEVAGRHDSFDACTAALGAFPSENRPRVLFLGLAPCAPLDALALDLQEMLRRAGFSLDAKPFHPHLTLARMAGGPARGLTRGARLPSRLLPARELLLVRSHLGPEARHEVLARWGMAGGMPGPA